MRPVVEFTTISTVPSNTLLTNTSTGLIDGKEWSAAHPLLGGGDRDNIEATIAKDSVYSNLARLPRMPPPPPDLHPALKIYVNNEVEFTIKERCTKEGYLMTEEKCDREVSITACTPASEDGKTPATSIAVHVYHNLICSQLLTMPPTFLVGGKTVSLTTEERKTVEFAMIYWSFIKKGCSIKHLDNRNALTQYLAEMCRRRKLFSRLLTLRIAEYDVMACESKTGITLHMQEHLHTVAENLESIGGYECLKLSAALYCEMAQNMMDLATAGNFEGKRTKQSLHDSYCIPSWSNASLAYKRAAVSLYRDTGSGGRRNMHDADILKLFRTGEDSIFKALKLGIPEKAELTAVKLRPIFENLIHHYHDMCTFDSEIFLFVPVLLHAMRATGCSSMEAPRQHNQAIKGGKLTKKKADKLLYESLKQADTKGFRKHFLSQLVNESVTPMPRFGRGIDDALNDDGRVSDPKSILYSGPTADLTRIEKGTAGQRCSHCAKEEDRIMSKCPCKTAMYCSKPCQTSAWKEHKGVCNWHLSKKVAAKK